MTAHYLSGPEQDCHVCQETASYPFTATDWNNTEIHLLARIFLAVKSRKWTLCHTAVMLIWGFNFVSLSPVYLTHNLQGTTDKSFGPPTWIGH